MVAAAAAAAAPLPRLLGVCVGAVLFAATASVMADCIVLALHFPFSTSSLLPAVLQERRQGAALLGGQEMARLPRKLSCWLWLLGPFAWGFAKKILFSHVKCWMLWESK